VTGPTIDVGTGQFTMIEPILTYKSEEEVNMLLWPMTLPEWISIVVNNRLEMLHI
jgi:hypothetical protein